MSLPELLIGDDGRWHIVSPIIRRISSWCAARCDDSLAVNCIIIGRQA